MDFEATSDPGDRTKVDFRVLPGGFPRAFVEEVRVAFGDDLAGWGERISHRYASDGTYAVEAVTATASFRFGKSMTRWFERSGAKQTESEFTRTDVSDLRGLPVWNMDRWTERS